MEHGGALLQIWSTFSFRFLIATPTRNPRIAAYEAIHNEKSPVMNAFKRWLRSPFLADLGERAGKSGIQGFIVGSAVEFSGIVDLRMIDWGSGLAIGGGMMLASILTSLLSYKRGNAGTASITHAVEVSE